VLTPETSTRTRGKEPDLLERRAVLTQRQVLLDAPGDVREDRRRQVPARRPLEVVEGEDRLEVHRIIGVRLQLR
jgi:hypothetical protein